MLIWNILTYFEVIYTSNQYVLSAYLHNINLKVDTKELNSILFHNSRMVLNFTEEYAT